MERIVIGASLALALIGCQGPSTWRERQAPMTSDAEALAGAAAAPALEAKYGGVERDSAAEARMRRIVITLCAGTDCLPDAYQLRILNSKSANALSLPGGRIYITRGLYARLGHDEHLAAVVAHEMAHLVAKDHFKPRCGSEDAALDREVCADLRAVCYLRAAGFRTDAMMEVIEIIRDEQPAKWSDIRATSAAAKSGQFKQQPEEV